MAEILGDNERRDLYRKMLNDAATAESTKKYSFKDFEKKLLGDEQLIGKISDLSVKRGWSIDKDDFFKRYTPELTQAPAPKAAPVAPVQQVVEPPIGIAAPKPFKEPAPSVTDYAREMAFEPQIEAPVKPIQEEPKGFFEGLGTQFQRGLAQGRAIQSVNMGQLRDAAQGKNLNAIPYEQIAAANRAVKDFGQTQTDIDLAKEEGLIKDAWDVVKALPGVTIESLASLGRSGLEEALVGAGTGAAAGSIIPGLGTAAGGGLGATAGMVQAGRNMEYFGTLMQELEANGVDITDARQLREGIAKYGKQADKTAITRANTIAAVESALPVAGKVAGTVAGRVGSKVAQKPLQAVSKALAYEPIAGPLGGATGELAAQIASGQEISPQDIALEAGGEGAATVAAVARAIKGQQREADKVVGKIVAQNKAIQAMEEAVNANPEAEGQIRQQYQKRIDAAAPTNEEVLNAYESTAQLPESEEKAKIQQNLEAYMAEKGIQPEAVGQEAGLGELMRREAPEATIVPPVVPHVAPEVAPSEDEDLAALNEQIAAIENAPMEEEVVTEEVPAAPIAPLNIDFSKNEGRNVNYQGVEGRIKIDSDGVPYVFTKDGDVVYIEGGLSGQTPQQLGEHPIPDEVKNEIDIETVLQDENAPLDQGQLEYDFDNNSITLYGKPFNYEGVEVNSKGQTTALRLKDANGKTKYVRNEDTILEFEIQKELYEKSKSNKPLTVESAIQAAEQLQVSPVARPEQVPQPVQQERPAGNLEGNEIIAEEETPVIYAEEAVPVEETSVVAEEATPTAVIPKQKKERAAKSKQIDRKSVESALGDAKEEYRKSKEAFDKKRAELDKSTKEDVTDVFGARKAQEKSGGLFEMPRISPEQREKAIQPFRDRMNKAKGEVNRLTKMLEEGEEAGKEIEFKKEKDEAKQLPRGRAEVREEEGGRVSEKGVPPAKPKKAKAVREPGVMSQAKRIETQNPEILAMQGLISLGRLHPNIIEKIFGGGRNKNVQGERKARIGYLDKKSKYISTDGIAERVAEFMAEALNMDVADVNEKYEVRGYVEDAIKNHNSYASMAKEILRLDAEDRKSLLDEEEAYGEYLRQQEEQAAILGAEYNQDVADEVWDAAFNQMTEDDWNALDRMRIMDYLSEMDEVETKAEETTPAPKAPETKPAEGVPKKTTEFSKAISASSRFRPREVVFFDTPIVGPNGNELISYQWAYEWTMKENKEGELVDKRISDWTQAESSAETGRDVVHKFTVRKPNGEIVTASSESIPSLLGYVKGEPMKGLPSVVSAVKTLAKQRMQLAILEAQEKEYNTLKEKYEKAEKPEIKEGKNWIPDDTRYSTYVMGDAKVHQDNKYNPETRSYEKIPLEKKNIEILEREWVENRVEEDGGKYPRSINELKQRIKRQERKVEEATKSKISIKEEAPTAKAEALVKEAEKKEEISDLKLQELVNRNSYNLIKKQESVLGEDSVDRARVIEQAKKIAEHDGKPLSTENIAEALQYEPSYIDNWADLRNAINKGGIQLNAEGIKRMLDVGVKLPSDIVELYNKSVPTSKQEGNASTEFDGIKKPSKIKTKSFDNKYGKGAFERMQNITQNFEDIMDGLSEKIKQDCL